MYEMSGHDYRRKIAKSIERADSARHLAINEAFLRRFAKPRLAPKAIAPLVPKPCFLRQMGRQESLSPLAGLDIKSGRFSLCLDAFPAAVAKVKDLTTPKRLEFTSASFASEWLGSPYWEKI